MTRYKLYPTSVGRCPECQSDDLHTAQADEIPPDGCQAVSCCDCESMWFEPLPPEDDQ